MSTMNQREFEKKANSIHQNKFDYSKSVYIDSRTKLIIICPIHGEFEQLPANHLFGSSCPKCSSIEKTNNSKHKIDTFLERAKLAHGDRYDYSKVIYKGTKTKVIIICKEHGEFEQIPESHYLGKGCAKCAGKGSNTDTFVKKSKEIHGDYYDYSKTKYISARDKLTITCKIHGDFEQIACNHTSGSGCPQCSLIKNANDRLLTNEEFIQRAKEVHGDLFDYSKTDYIASRENLTITCKIHGDFIQKANNHLNGAGCQKCFSEASTSKQELELLSFVREYYPNCITNDRTIISNNNELDIFIPELNLSIEYNGIYWHSEIKTPDKNYHLNKTEECESQGIQLIHIFEDEWLNKLEIVKSRLLNIFGKNQTKIYGRKCDIKNVESNVARDFLNNNHIQRFVGCSHYIGLYHQDELVSLMSFGDLRANLGQTTSDEGTFELVRFCNKLNTTVIGSASKLFKHFIKTYEPTKIISYADRRWSQGNLYEVLGFQFKHNSVPNYFYVVGNQRLNRYNFRKDILISKYGCEATDTEHNFCFNQGWYRIYDCGTKLYEWRK